MARRRVTGYGVGQAKIPLAPIPVENNGVPTSKIAFDFGQLVQNSVTGTWYISSGNGIFEIVAGVPGVIDTLTGGSGGAISPVASNITLAGTANQIATVGTAGTITFSLIGPYTPATYTAHGVLLGEGTSSIVATAAGTTGQVLIGSTGANPAFGALGVNSGLTAHGVLLGEGNSAIVATSAGTAGQLLVSGGASADPTWTTATFPTTAGATGTILRSNGTNWVATTDTYPNTVVAGDLIAATATNVIGSLADVAVGQLLASGGVGVMPAYTASPSVTGSITAGTTLTATVGAITATNGNLVLGTAGNKILSTSVATTTTAGANAFGTVTLVGGTATVATTAVTASSIIFLTRMTVGATGAAALGILSVGTITASTSFVINAWTTANATVLATTDVSNIGWMIVN